MIEPFDNCSFYLDVIRAEKRDHARPGLRTTSRREGVMERIDASGPEAATGSCGA